MRQGRDRRAARHRRAQERIVTPPGACRRVEGAQQDVRLHAGVERARVPSRHVGRRHRRAEGAIDGAHDKGARGVLALRHRIVVGVGPRAVKVERPDLDEGRARRHEECVRQRRAVRAHEDVRPPHGGDVRAQPAPAKVVGRTARWPSRHARRGRSPSPAGLEQLVGVGDAPCALLGGLAVDKQDRERLLLARRVAPSSLARRQAVELERRHDAARRPRRRDGRYLVVHILEAADEQPLEAARRAVARGLAPRRNVAGRPHRLVGEPAEHAHLEVDEAPAADLGREAHVAVDHAQVEELGDGRHRVEEEFGE
eukprot:2866018-Prymnesium_polylepis.1